MGEDDEDTGEVAVSEIVSEKRFYLVRDMAHEVYKLMSEKPTLLFFRASGMFRWTGGEERYNVMFLPEVMEELNVPVAKCWLVSVKRMDDGSSVIRVEDKNVDVEKYVR